MQGNGDYISREAVVSSLSRLCDRVCQYSEAQRNVMCGACPLGDAFTVIEDDIPAADVRPVVRGKWVRTSYRSGYGYKCSVCGDIYHRSKNKLNFCPNCGADMRPKEEGDT